MPTIADNIQAMAKLVADVKKMHHLTEPTVLRIVDMNFALAQAAGAASFGGDEQMPWDAIPGEPPENPEGDGTDVNTGQIVQFEGGTDVNINPDDEELIATTERKPN